MVRQKNTRGGQAMLIAVLSLGGAMMGAIAIAGFLTLYQVRASTDSVNSAKAIFAADTGVNWALFSYFCPNETFLGKPRCKKAPTAPSLVNGASVVSTCYDASGVTVDCYTKGNSTVQYAVSIGNSQSARRAFYLNMLVSTSTFP